MHDTTLPSICCTRLTRLQLNLHLTKPSLLPRQNVRGAITLAPEAATAVIAQVAPSSQEAERAAAADEAPILEYVSNVQIGIRPIQILPAVEEGARCDTRGGRAMERSAPATTKETKAAAGPGHAPKPGPESNEGSAPAADSESAKSKALSPFLQLGRLPPPLSSPV
ncbi:hypothetical protein BJV78DRAFT_1364155 [Lactifluus subvellereus]|nr:hypothetical protein BJV78DRAFT_1364155 [Lactifluus subvellereus]